jgi:hypothetical protein
MGSDFRGSHSYPQISKKLIVAHQTEPVDLNDSVVITSTQHLGHEAFDAIHWGTLIGTAISCLNEA